MALRYVDVNDAACRALGYSHAELLALGPLDIFSATREQLRVVAYGYPRTLKRHQLTALWSRR